MRLLVARLGRAGEERDDVVETERRDEQAQLRDVVREDRVRPTCLREPFERGERVREQLPAHVRIDVEPPCRVGELERPLGRVPGGLVRPAELRRTDAHQASGSHSSGCATSGRCQGKPSRRCGRNVSAECPCPGSSASSVSASRMLQPVSPRRWASVPSKSQIARRATVTLTRPAGRGRGSRARRPRRRTRLP